MLTGLVLGIVGLARDEALLSGWLLVCSPEERSAFAEVDWPGDTKPAPEPQFSTGACVASLEAPGPPAHASERLIEGLEMAGWRVQPRAATGEAPLSGTMLAATKARFYCEVDYLPPGAGPPGQTAALVRVRLGRI